MRLNLLIVLCVFFGEPLLAQVIPSDTTSPYVYDTFFLAKKKGLFGRLARSISNDPPKPGVTATGTIKNDLPYNKYKGRFIRNINITRLGLDRSIDDTTKRKNNFGTRLGKTFHRTTREDKIRDNLFFAEGDRLFPALLADNERHLREQAYIQDARIIVRPVPGSNNEVDVTVIIKDVFSIGGNLNISNTHRGRMTIKDENLYGRGARLAFSGLYDNERDFRQSFGGEYIHRNIFHSLADWTIGFSGYNPSINTGQLQETDFYTSLNKPLVSPYIPWIGGLEGSYHRTKDVYADTAYLKNTRYEFYNIDAWMGYNIGAKKSLRLNTNNRLRKFIGMRAVNANFQKVPDSFATNYSYLYADLTGVLGSFTVLKQYFYKTKFIYGFGGRYEDVPEGFSASIVSGWTRKNGRNRPYYGLDFQRFLFTNKGDYFNYTFKFGGYYSEKKFQDIDVLLNIDFFTKLYHISSAWNNRNFISLGYTRQLNPFLNEPLKITSEFGIPAFRNGTIAADMRTTLKAESVFYSNWYLLGFGFAPFIFSDFCLLKPIDQPYSKSDLYSSLGGGVRTRNESLVFGTIELKGYYFPRTIEGMKGYKIELTTRVRFKYNSEFIRKPDFVSGN